MGPYCVIKPFYTGMHIIEIVPVIPLSYALKTLTKFVKGQNDKNICEMYDLCFE